MNAGWDDDFAARHPGKGRAVLACRCGQVLDADQMHRQVPPRKVPKGCLVIRPIVCVTCAGRAS